MRPSGENIHSPSVSKDNPSSILESEKEVAIPPLDIRVEQQDGLVILSYTCHTPEECGAYKESIGYAVDRFQWERQQTDEKKEGIMSIYPLGFTPFSFFSPGTYSVEIETEGEERIAREQIRALVEKMKQGVSPRCPSHEVSQKQLWHRWEEMLDWSGDESLSPRGRVLVTDPGGVMLDKYRQILIRARSKAQGERYERAIKEVFRAYNPRERLRDGGEVSKSEPLLAWELDLGPHSRAFIQERMQDVRAMVGEGASSE